MRKKDIRNLTKKQKYNLEKKLSKEKNKGKKEDKKFINEMINLFIQ